MSRQSIPFDPGLTEEQKAVLKAVMQVVINVHQGHLLSTVCRRHWRWRRVMGRTADKPAWELVPLVERK